MVRRRKPTPPPRCFGTVSVWRIIKAPQASGRMRLHPVTLALGIVKNSCQSKQKSRCRHVARPVQIEFDEDRHIITLRNTSPNQDEQESKTGLVNESAICTVRHSHVTDPAGVPG